MADDNQMANFHPDAIVKKTPLKLMESPERQNSQIAKN